MRKTPINAIAGQGGTYLVTGTTTVTKKFYAFIPNTDCVVAEIYHEGSAVNQVSNYGISGATLKAGIPFMCQGENVFSAIKLTSGDVAIYLD